MRNKFITGIAHVLDISVTDKWLRDKGYSMSFVKAKVPQNIYLIPEKNLHFNNIGY